MSLEPTNKRCANRQFTSYSTNSDIEEKEQSAEISEDHITVKTVNSAITSSKTLKALGPYGIAPMMLKNLEPNTTRICPQHVPEDTYDS